MDWRRRGPSGVAGGPVRRARHAGSSDLTPDHRPGPPAAILPIATNPPPAHLIDLRDSEVSASRLQIVGILG
jgi:hypothetical protein